MIKVISLFFLTFFFPFPFSFSFATQQATQQTVDLATLEGFFNVDKVRPTTENQKAVIYFWAEWCPDCREKLKGELRDLHRQGIQIFTINRDRRPDKAKHFLNKYDIELPVYLDPSRKMSKALKAFSVPHWAVIQHRRNRVWTVLKTGAGNFAPARAELK